MLENAKALVLTMLVMGCIFALPIVALILVPIVIFYAIKVVMLVGAVDEDDD